MVEATLALTAQLGIRPFEATDYLQSDKDCAKHLSACMDDAPEDAALFTKAVGDIGRARGMMQLAATPTSPEKGFRRRWANKALQLCDRYQSPPRTGLAIQCGGKSGAGVSSL